MTDLIDRQALLEQFRAIRDKAAESSRTYGDKDPLDEDEMEVIATDYDDVIKLVEDMPSAQTILSVADVRAQTATPPEPEEGETMWVNHYKCPDCDNEWTDTWPAQCDDDCPACGCRHISPTKSEEVE